MELLNEMRCFSKTHKLYSDIMRECIMGNMFEESETILNESDITTDPNERERVLDDIRNDKYVVDDYETFLSELGQNKRYQFLTPYTAEEFADAGVHTYQVEGYPIGFALKPQEKGGMDIVSIHNNSDIRGIGHELIESAKRLGGNMLDHFDGFLTDFYSQHGFNEYERFNWDEQYAPKDWDYDTYGTPDVIMRRL